MRPPKDGRYKKRRKMQREKMRYNSRRDHPHRAGGFAVAVSRRRSAGIRAAQFLAGVDALGAGGDVRVDVERAFQPHAARTGGDGAEGAGQWHGVGILHRRVRNCGRNRDSAAAIPQRGGNLPDRAAAGDVSCERESGAAKIERGGKARDGAVAAASHADFVHRAPLVVDEGMKS